MREARPTEANQTPPPRLRLGTREIDFARGMLCDQQGKAIEIRPQVWAVLQHLARNANRVVTKDDLLEAVWPGLVVTDGSVAQAISDVRIALGDSDHRVVKTVPRRGYLLLTGDAAVTTTTPEAPTPDPPRDAARTS